MFYGILIEYIVPLIADLFLGNVGKAAVCSDFSGLTDGQAANRAADLLRNQLDHQRVTAYIADNGSGAAAFFGIQFVSDVFAKQGKQIILTDRADFQSVIALREGTVSGQKEDVPSQL